MYVRAIYIPLSSSSCEISSLDPGPSRFKGEGGASPSSPLTLRRRVVDLPSPYPPFSQSPKPPSTDRDVTLVSWLSVGKARRAAIKPTFWQIASVFIMWEYFCGRHSARKRMLDQNDFRRIREPRYTEVLFSLPFERAV